MDSSSQEPRLRRRSLRRSMVAASIMCLVGTGGAAAQAAADTARPMSLREQAATLARAGWAAQDPRVVLAAAQLLIILDRGGGGIRRTDAGATRPAVPNDWDLPAELEAKSLLRLASEVAVGRRDRVTAQIAAALASRAELGPVDTSLARALSQAAEALGGVRGAVGQPRWVEGYLQADEVAEFAIPFEGRGVTNQVSVSVSDGQGGVRCDLFERRSGALVPVTTQSTGARKGQCRLSWRQDVQGTVTLRITSIGPPGYFVLLTN